MQYDFDTLLDRHGTKSSKWDYIADRFGKDDVLPFSLADADFPAFPGITEAIIQRTKVPNYGYSRWNDPAYYNAIANWYKNDPACDSLPINPDWIVYGPSVIYFVSALIKEFSSPGDTVATFMPMYDAFFRVIESNNRNLLPVNINGPVGGYSFDLQEVQKAVEKPETKIFILTNPHNPTGYVWSKQELTDIYNLCRTNNTFLISDDIHSGIIIGSKQYYPITNLLTSATEQKPTMALLNSTSKTFNSAGLGGAFAFIPNNDLKQSYLHRTKDMDMVNSASCFSIEAAIAGYNNGLDYVQQMRKYIKGNYETLVNFFDTNAHLGIKAAMQDATYVAWLDTTDVNLTEDELQDKLINKGHVGILKGSLFGGQHNLRINIGCPRPMLIDGLNRLKTALE